MTNGYGAGDLPAPALADYAALWSTRRDVMVYSQRPGRARVISDIFGRFLRSLYMAGTRRYSERLTTGWAATGEGQRPRQLKSE